MMSQSIFDPHLYIQTITLVGIGGTGAQAARTIGRILYDMKRQRRSVPQLVLIDPDTVEAKNVGRQLFSPSVLGMNKAEAVGRTLNMALGLDVAWIPQGFDPERHTNRRGNTLLVSCVDNYAARQAIYAVRGCGVFAGNHRHSGQVCIGNCDDIDRILDNLEGETVRYLPTEGTLFPSLLAPEPAPEPSPETLSCAELTAAGEQSLLINDWMAAVVGSYVYKLLHRQPIPTFLTYINADNCVVQSKPICREELSFYLGGDV